jgi:hypothetical protein
MPGIDWPKNRTGAGVRASIVAQASREAARTMPNGPKASNDRWSQGDAGRWIEKERR